MEEHVLDDTWTLYYHDPENANWTLQSYVRLACMSSIEDFWPIHDAMLQHLSKGMFFVMREHVAPCWDDPENIDGGCVSLKILKDDVQQTWEFMIVRLLSESIAGKDGSPHVNGISISPKRFFCIVKVWFKNADHIADLQVPPSYTGEVITKMNRSNMLENNQPKNGSGGIRKKHHHSHFSSHPKHSDPPPLP